MSKTFQDACPVPSKLLLNETFGGNVSNTFAIVSLLFRTIEYRAGYCSLRVDWPSQISSQKRISDPSLIEKDPCGKKNFFVAISLPRSVNHQVSKEPEKQLDLPHTFS
jgi:hypothetical protein